MILYFSGTGNSKYVAQQLSEKLGDGLVNLNQTIKSGVDLNVLNEDRLIIVYPTYAARMPRFMHNYLLKQQFKQGAKTFFVTTCGASACNQAKSLKHFCDLKDISYVNFYSVVMPENYIALFAAPSEENAKKIILKADSKIAEIATNIQSELAPKRIVGFKKCPYADIFYKFVVGSKGFKVGDNCVSCGKCAELCTLNNISIVDGKPRWGNDCTHCMACINYCPTEAIQYKHSTQKKRRYKFPQQD